MPVGGHSNTARRRRIPPRPGLTRTVYPHPSSDVQSHVAAASPQRLPAGLSSAATGGRGNRREPDRRGVVGAGTGASAELGTFEVARAGNAGRVLFGGTRRRCGYAVRRDRLRDLSERSPESGGGRCTRRPRAPLAAVAVFALAPSQSGRPMTPGSGQGPWQGWYLARGRRLAGLRLRPYRSGWLRLASRAFLTAPLCEG